MKPSHSNFPSAPSTGTSPVKLRRSGSRPATWWPMLPSTSAYRKFSPGPAIRLSARRNSSQLRARSSSTIGNVAPGAAAAHFIARCRPLSALRIGPCTVTHDSTPCTGPPRTAMYSVSLTACSSWPRNRKCPLRKSIFSKYKSCVSNSSAVMPHAILSLWPIRTPGTPGSVTPATFRPGACNCTAYHVAGIVNSRCGSFASIALPLFVRLPLTAQAFEPGVISPPLRMGNSRSTRSG